MRREPGRLVLRGGASEPFPLERRGKFVELREHPLDVETAVDVARDERRAQGDVDGVVRKRRRAARSEERGTSLRGGGRNGAVIEV